MKLVLGTAQFGLDYGITNTGGKVDRKKVQQILEAAQSYGITTLDTAVAYGDSEQVLGDCCAEINAFEFISKLTIDSSQPYSILKAIEGSCDRLKVNALYALMVHNADVLLENHGSIYWADFEKAKCEGRVRKIGVSVYNPEQAKKILENYDIDIIQIPFNLLDQRFKQSGLLKIFQQRNIEVHARSIFLQGLLLSDYTQISDYFKPIRNSLHLINNICIEKGINRLSVIFEFLKSIKDIDSVVFGVTSLRELEEVIATFSRKQVDGLEVEFNQLAVADEKFINPTCWR